MKKIFTINVSPYPITYTIEAETAEQAKEQAKDWYHTQFDGKRVYETVVVSEEVI